MSQPESVPPEDVRLVFADAHEHPVSCVYDGWDEAAHVHVWRVVDAPRFRRIKAVRIGMLPAHTEVRL